MKKQENNTVSLWDKLVTFPQYLIPHHFLSMTMYRLTRSEVTWFKTLFIWFIVKAYNVNINEAAEKDIYSFSSFNTFFTRKLRAGVRPIAKGNKLASPVDGAISQIGNIEAGRIIQAKGQDYSVIELLAGNEALAKQFDGGQFTTIYLSPSDYHRIHMPVTGTLQKMTYIPGKLFSVSPRTARAVPKLFARNERVVTVFETEQGPMALILVGAIFVGSMETVWQGQITPPYGKEIQHWNYENEQAITLEKGQEMGRFNMGSTVIILLPEQASKFDLTLKNGQSVVMGQAMT